MLKVDVKISPCQELTSRLKVDLKISPCSGLAVFVHVKYRSLAIGQSWGWEVCLEGVEVSCAPIFVHHIAFCFEISFALCAHSAIHHPWAFCCYVHCAMCMFIPLPSLWIMVEGSWSFELLQVCSSFVIVYEVLLVCSLCLRFFWCVHCIYSLCSITSSVPN
jgi:hypothetical protein